MEELKYKLAFYVPETHLESVKQALFAAGAGKWEHYDQVCWQCLGWGQFRPLEGAQPAVGALQSLTKISEYKVEMICLATHIHQAIAALKQAHPYEEVAFEVIRLEVF